MEVSGQLDAPAILPPEKVPLIPIGEEAGWAPEQVWTPFVVVSVRSPVKSE